MLQSVAMSSTFAKPFSFVLANLVYWLLCLFIYLDLTFTLIYTPTVWTSSSAWPCFWIVFWISLFAYNKLPAFRSCFQFSPWQSESYQSKVWTHHYGKIAQMSQHEWITSPDSFWVHWNISCIWVSCTDEQISLLELIAVIWLIQMSQIRSPKESGAFMICKIWLFIVLFCCHKLYV